jgi:glycosyltransferase involved in cell wall biosynthesis
MLKAGIFDPYLDTLGGGERYVLTVAEILSQNGYDVDLFWDGDTNLLNKASSRFELKLDNIHFVPNIFANNIAKRLLLLQKYDLIFYLSDGSVPFLFSRQNYLHFQVPFTKSQKNILNYLKFKLVDQVICNSKFTQKFTTQNYTAKNVVLYPPVDITKFSISKKEKIILSVGRFDNILNAKRQDVLINSFKKLSPSANGWKLVLAGGSLQSSDKNQYLKDLQKQAIGFPIEFSINPDFSILKNLYSHASIFWHAAGFGVDEVVHPEATEHFGMTVVEAMSAGLAPIVTNRGGLPEIITHQQNGYLFETESELISQTIALINNPKLLSTISIAAKNTSTQFSKQIFQDNLLKLIKQ